MKRILFVLLALVTMSASANDRLKPFVGEFEGTFEQLNPHQKDAQWTAAPVRLSGRWIVSEHYAELRGTFRLTGFEKPMEFVFLWSWDPFQKEYRLALLEDFAGLLDVFEQDSTAPLTLSNVSHGTFFEDEHGRTFNRVIVHFLETGSVRMEFAGSRDGKKWQEFARVTFKRAI